VLEGVEKKRKGDLKMKMTAKEFDERFDNGEDIFDLMENPKVMKLKDFEKEFLEKSVTINFSQEVYAKLKEKANLLKVEIEDLIKIIMAEKIGVLR
jgi:hypothetical protein